jgi:hypothetical protein
MWKGIVVKFRHGKIFGVVSHQNAIVLQRHSGNDGVGEGESAAFVGPFIFEDAG